jgi:hypothetical protein
MLHILGLGRHLPFDFFKLDAELFCSKGCLDLEGFRAGFDTGVIAARFDEVEHHLVVFFCPPICQVFHPCPIHLAGGGARFVYEVVAHGDEGVELVPNSRRLPGFPSKLDAALE